MDRELLLLRAAELFIRYRLIGWKIDLRTRTGHWLGRCVYGTKTIVISEFYARHNPDEDVLDTLLHEIAHALTPGHGHDRVWQFAAWWLGATPKATCQKQVLIRPGRYRATCPSCCRQYHKYRKPRYRCDSLTATCYFCSLCGGINGRLVFTSTADQAASR